MADADVGKVLIHVDQAHVPSLGYGGGDAFHQVPAEHRHAQLDFFRVASVERIARREIVELHAAWFVAGRLGDEVAVQQGVPDRPE